MAYTFGRKMKHASIVWNVVRVVLIVICCYQIVLVYLDSMQAARMLQRVDSSKPFSQDHSELDPSRVVVVLMRRGGDPAFGWLAGLGLLALLPYASVSKGLEREQESPNKPAHPTAGNVLI
jgi:hypothetical protein